MELYLIKGVYEKPTMGILQSKRGTLYPDQEQGKDVSAHLSNQWNQARKEIKGIKTGKLSLFIGDMILYIENPKESTPKLLELINTANLQNIRSLYKNQLYLYKQSRSNPKIKLEYNSIQNNKLSICLSIYLTIYLYFTLEQI